MADKKSHKKKPAAKRAPPAKGKAKADKLLLSARQGLAKTRQTTTRAAAKAGAAAGSATRKTSDSLQRGSRRSWLAIGKFSSQKLLPRLRQTGQWLRRRLHPSALAADYRRFLLLLHKLGPDRSVERLCFAATGKPTPLSVLRIPHQLRRSGHDYRPTPRLVFKWAMEALPEKLSRHAFVDYGAGRGRVLLMASHYPFEKIAGAEIAEELFEDCLLNIAQYPRSLMKCRDTGCEHLSAMRLDVPDQETVFYLNNPFNKVMLGRVVEKIVRSYKQNPRRFHVICIDIDARLLFEDTGIFHAVTIPWRQRLKHFAFSPYSIAIYRSVI